jgi:hypothetical protein
VRDDKSSVDEAADTEGVVVDLVDFVQALPNERIACAGLAWVRL